MQRVNVITTNPVRRSQVVPVVSNLNKTAYNLFGVKALAIEWYGILRLQREIDVPDTIAWDYYLVNCKTKGMKYGWIPQSEADVQFQQILTGLPDCCLLMTQSVFDKFNALCDTLDITVARHNLAELRSNECTPVR